MSVVVIHVVMSDEKKKKEWLAFIFLDDMWMRGDEWNDWIPKKWSQWSTGIEDSWSDHNNCKFPIPLQKALVVQ